MYMLMLWIIFLNKTLYFLVRVSSLISTLFCCLGRQSAGFSFSEGLSGWVCCCKATIFSINGCCHRNMYRNICGTDLCRSQHWKHHQRLYTQPEGRQQIDTVKERRQYSTDSYWNIKVWDFFSPLVLKVKWWRNKHKSTLCFHYLLFVILILLPKNGHSCFNWCHIMSVKCSHPITP